MKNLLIALTIGVLIYGCSEVSNEMPSYAEETISTPQLFAPGIISTEDKNEFDVCFSPDGKTVYFTRRIPDQKQKIYRTDYVDGEWTTAEIASFSTDRDETPFITPDGNTMFFGSEREIPGKPNKGGFDMNIWKMNKQDDTWSTPEVLPEPINYVQVEGEKWPSSNSNFFFTQDGETFYFTTMMRGDAAIDVHTTQLVDEEFTTPTKVEGLFENDSLWKYSAFISPDSKYMVFNSYGAPDGQGGEDLYISRNTGKGWSKAVNMGNVINTEGEESNGRFSPDGKYFFYTHADNLGNYEYGTWSIYFVETEYLALDALFE